MSNQVHFLRIPTHKSVGRVLPSFVIIFSFIRGTFVSHVPNTVSGTADMSKRCTCSSQGPTGYWKKQTIKETNSSLFQVAVGVGAVLGEAVRQALNGTVISKSLRTSSRQHGPHPVTGPRVSLQVY